METYIDDIEPAAELWIPRLQIRERVPIPELADVERLFDMSEWALADRYRQGGPDWDPRRFPPLSSWRDFDSDTALQPAIAANTPIDEIVQTLQPGQEMDTNALREDAELRAAVVSSPELSRFVLYEEDMMPCRRCASLQTPCIVLTCGGPNLQCLLCLEHGHDDCPSWDAELELPEEDDLELPENVRAHELESLHELCVVWGFRRWHDLRGNRPSALLLVMEEQQWRRQEAQERHAFPFGDILQGP